MKKLLFSLFTILAFVACSDDIEEAYEITFETPTTETEAINTPYGKSTVIKFTAEAAWTADVVGTRAVDWCSVSPTSGEAGEATITITTTTNDTSEERSAQVVIKSGSTEKSIEVTQKAAPQPNEIFYTSVDGKIVKPNITDYFGANIVSNTYENGQGVITFDGNITIIGQNGFSGCATLKSIEIPESIETICATAFWECSSLESITIPESVTTIHENVFYKCSSLSAFYGKYASADNRCLIYNSTLIAFAPVGSITTYTIPEGVTRIGDSAFNGCSSLKNIDIPNGVTEIGGNAFEGCSSLTTITIPEGVPSIDGWTFRDCSSLTTVDIPNSVTHIGDSAFYRCSSLTSINIPEGVTKIRLCTFNDCFSLTDVNIPNSVTTIERFAFNGCFALQSITLPDSITLIEDEAFQGCHSLTNIDIPKGITEIKFNTFYGCISLKNIDIPNNITSIGEGAFRDCSSLESITISESVSSIGENAFLGCSSLTSITIPESVTSIGEGAFINCPSLKAFYGKYSSSDNLYLNIDGELKQFACAADVTDYTIPEDVTSIGYAAFWGCSSLKSINLPNSIISISNSAFTECKNLTTMYCKPTTPPELGSGVFHPYDDISNRVIYVPIKSLADYKAAGGWKEYVEYIRGYSF